MKKHFVIFCGGPGLFDQIELNEDIRHDVAWSSYVTAPALRMKSTMHPVSFEQDETITLLICRPPFEDRWKDDFFGPDGGHQRDQVQSVIDQLDASRPNVVPSYIEFINWRNDERRQNPSSAAQGWDLQWFDTRSDFWEILRSLKGKISRLWFYGHSSDAELWMRVRRPRTGAHPEDPRYVHFATMPDAYSRARRPIDDEVIDVKEVRDNFDLADKFLATQPPTVTDASPFPDSAHRLITCNSMKRHGPPSALRPAIAEVWRDVFQVHVAGRDNRADFGPIFENDTYGEPTTQDPHTHGTRTSGTVPPDAGLTRRDLLALYGPPDVAKALHVAAIGPPPATLDEVYEGLATHFQARDNQIYGAIDPHVKVKRRKDWAVRRGPRLAHRSIRVELETGYDEIVIHESGLYEGATPRDLENYSMVTEDMDDIQWHFIVDRGGIVYEARNLNFRGNQFADSALEPGKVGICVIGDFENDLFFLWGGDPVTRGQQNALAGLVKGLKAAFPTINKLQSHSTHEAAKDCPGDNLQILVPVLRKLV